MIRISPSWRPFAAALVAVSLAAISPAAPHGRDPEQKAPDAAAKPLTAYAWKSKNDLRYVWWLPKDYDAAKPRNLSVICHGTGLDYRWGLWNNKPGIFRPDDVVVSVDGPSPDGETRLFLGEKKDADAFAAFLKEMRESFAVERVFLYGHSQGGFFVVYFAGEHPDLVSGVVAHASGAWNWSKTRGDVQKVAIAFLHGTSDPVVPYRQSPGSRDAYAKAGFDRLHLRRLDRYNHWPNAVRATETLAWCEGMTTTSPEEALRCAVAILQPKRPDEHQWTTLVGFSGARDVLRRFEKKGPVPFADVPEAVAAKAAELAKKIEDAGAEHVAALSKQVASKKDLTLDGEPWLGHLVPLREDFRGVESVEAYLEKIGFDAARTSQQRAADALVGAWYDGRDQGKVYEAIVENLGKAFLFDGYPPELAEKMKGWHAKEDELRIPATARKKYADFEAWQRGWEEGSKQYAAIWKSWKPGP